MSSIGDREHQSQQNLALGGNRVHETFVDDSPTLDFRTPASDCLELESELALDDSEGSVFLDSDDTASEYSCSDGDEADFFECSSQPRSPAPDGLLSEHVSVLTETGVKAFLRTWPRSHTRKRRGSWPSSPGCRKRLKVECFEEYVGGEQGTAIHEGAILDGIPRPMRREFACPFYTRHPDHYPRCLTHVEIRGVRGLLKHLYTAHIRPIYCPTCQAIFTTTRECDDHIRSRQCKLREPSHCLGITPEQVQQLSKQAHNWRVAGLEPNYVMEALQWFAIWTIVFPKDELPLRPYLSGDLESAVCALRDFWSTEGPIIVARFLESQAPQCACSQREGRNVEALQRAVLDRMIDSLVTSFRQDKCDRLHGPEKAQQVLASLGRLFSKDHMGSTITAT